MVSFAIIRQYAQRSADVYLEAQELSLKYSSSIVKMIPHLDIQFMIETDEKQRTHFISIRGTANLENAKIDAEIVKIHDEKLGGYFHHGFWESARAIYFSLPALIKDFEIRLTGHSLGGAIATILAMYLKVDGYRLGQVITFGAPKVTNRPGVKKFRDLPLLRVVNDDDPVPFLPPSTFLTWLDDGLYHHLGIELILFAGEKYILYNQRKSERIGISSLWLHLFDLEVENHYIKAYQSNLFMK